MKSLVARVLSLGVLLLLLVSTTAAAISRDSWTLWPLFDLRQDADTEDWSLQLLGPVFAFTRTPEGSLQAMRPLFAHEVLADDRQDWDVLYPLWNRRQDEASGRWSLLNLTTNRQSLDQTEDFTIFPLYFSTLDEEGVRHRALFPLGGEIRNSFGRDRIRFTLFPLYSQTERDGTRTTNLLWPFLAQIDSTEDRDEHGFKFWPFYGYAERAGVYRRQMALWPLYLRNDERLNTDNPRQLVASFPFYYDDRTTERHTRAWFWPFFLDIRNLEDGGRDLWAPWPLVRYLEGPDRHGRRFLPFYSDETWPGNRKVWWLWPLYKREERWSEDRYRERDRVLFFLYSHLRETKAEQPVKARNALWPLYTWEEINGHQRFYTFALLEPFFPDNRAIERSWGPLYRIFRWESDPQEGVRASLAWNLFWLEARDQDQALELFPLFSWRRQPSRNLYEWKLVKGLIGLRSDAEKKTLYLLFLPIKL